MADIDELARRFRDSGNDQNSRSPFNAGLNRRIADRPAIVALLQSAPEQQQLPVLLLAAVHSIVLTEPDLELARWYPTVSADPLVSDPFPAFERLCRDREADLRTIIATHVTQTNEVGRSALFLPALGLVADETGPISLIDVGTSAGLNLQLDRFAYSYSPGGTVGGPSTVMLEIGTRGPVPIPQHMPQIASRVGIDQHPIDVRDPDAARWLMACVWPDQPDRFTRLRNAIEIARHHPTRTVRGDAVDVVAATVAEAAANGHPVVLNSWVLNYLPEQRQREYVAQLDAVGRRRDLSWVYAEAPAMCPGIPFTPDLADQHVTALMLARWSDGARTIAHLGNAHPHGYWVHWTG